MTPNNGAYLRTRGRNDGDRTFVRTTTLINNGMGSALYPKTDITINASHWFEHRLRYADAG